MANDGKAYVLNADGSLFNSFQIGVNNPGSQVWSSPSLGSDGTVWVVGGDGNLYSIQGNSATAAGSWPNWRLNSRHIADARNNKWVEGTVSSLQILELALPSGNATPQYSQGFVIDDSDRLGGSVYSVVNGALGYNAVFGDIGIAFSGRPYGATFAVNNRGEIAGYSGSGLANKGMRRALNGNNVFVATTLDPLPSFSNASASAIDNRGNVFGVSYNSTTFPIACKWAPSSTTATPFDPLETGSGSTISGVSLGLTDGAGGNPDPDAGVGRLVGRLQKSGVWQGYFMDARMSDLLNAVVLGSAADLNGNLFPSEALAINGASEIVGNTTVSGNLVRPFLKRMVFQNGVLIPGAWIVPGAMPATLGGSWATARAINDRDQIVGEAKDSSGNSRAFIWLPNSSNPIDLNSFLLSGAQGATYFLVAAYQINDSGRVIGIATKTQLGQVYTIGFVAFPQ